MPRTLICVSHCDGAGGGEVARLVADELGLRYVDEDIIATAARKAGAATEVIADAEQRKSLLRRMFDELGASGAGMPAAAGFPPPVSAEPPPLRSDELRRFIVEAIEAIAARGRIVIGAHGASFALTPRDDLLRVFVTASAAARARRFSQGRGVDETEARRQISDADKARADYLKRFYGVDREIPSHYDLVINTDVLSPAEAASIVAHAAR